MRQPNQPRAFQLRKRRVFSEAFKREKVAQIAAGHYSIAQFCQLWSVSTASVYRWIYRYSPDHQKGTTMIVQLDSEAAKTQQLLQEVAQLQQALDQKQMIIDFQNQLIELASKELQLDLKKTFSPPRSNTSASTALNTPMP